MESIQCDLPFAFINLSETAHSFANIHAALKIKNNDSFIKTRFYWKRGCIIMRKHAKTFHTNKGYKLAIAVFILTFSKQNFVVHFSNVICTKTRPCTRLLFVSKLISSALSFIWYETNGNVFSLVINILGLEVLFFQLVCFSVVHFFQVQGPVFRRWLFSHWSFYFNKCTLRIFVFR